MNVVYLGSGKFGIECLNALACSGHTLSLVVTGAPHSAGRGRKSQPTPIARWAKEQNIAFIESDKVNTPEVIEKIAEHKPELLVVIAFGQKIGKELVNLPPKGATNVHASLLPKYRGAAPINWAIINGEIETGISIIALAEKMDAGAICSWEKTDIAPDETAGQLHDRLARMAAPLLLKTIAQIADGTIVYTEQDHRQATLAPKLKKSDGFLDFNETADSLVRKVRGFGPWPEASAIYVSKKTSKCVRVVIAKAQAVENSNPANLAVGILDENLNVICAQDALKIVRIKPAGGRVMDFKDFVNGRQTVPDDLFMKIED